MARTRIKICGITRNEDARLAVDLGADAIGINFHPPSPRYVDPRRIASIVADLPPFVTVVGLFVNAPQDEVNEVLAAGHIQCLQFHGDETPEFCTSFGLPWYKAVRVADLESARRLMQPFRGLCSLLLDTYVKDAPGGTGTVFDWTIATTLGREGFTPLILAGGLTPHNVAAAIELVKPWGVDVCSSVESAPGIKDSAKLREFFSAVL